MHTYFAVVISQNEPGTFGPLKQLTVSKNAHVEEQFSVGWLCVGDGGEASDQGVLA